MRLFSHFLILLFFISCTEIRDVPQYEGNDDFPTPYSWVNDYVGVLNAKEEASLNKKIQKYKDETTKEVVIVFMDALPFVKRNNSNSYMTVAQYTTKLGDLWGVGETEKNNGMVILSFIEEREMFISTGYGTEKIISDAEVAKVIDEIFVPNYQKSKHFKACNEGLDALFKLWEEGIKNEDQQPPTPSFE